MPDIYAVKLLVAGRPDRAYYCERVRVSWLRLRITMFNVRHQLFNTKTDPPTPAQVTREGTIRAAGIPWTIRKIPRPTWWDDR